MKKFNNPNGAAILAIYFDADGISSRIIFRDGLWENLSSEAQNSIKEESGVEATFYECVLSIPGIERKYLSSLLDYFNKDQMDLLTKIELTRAKLSLI